MLFTETHSLVTVEREQDVIEAAKDFTRAYLASDGDTEYSEELVNAEQRLVEVTMQAMATP